jgi:enoyl-CoA hydratase/3-hydroxyacyl-CoA dehydrogenase
MSQRRIIGMHFFSPAHVMQLLEIVRTQETSKQVIVDILKFASMINKTPLVVRNCAGFAINRIFFPYSEVALFLGQCNTFQNLNILKFKEESILT